MNYYPVAQDNMARNFHINSNSIVAPIAAFTMAGLLYVYARSSIRAAKSNAERTRSADGGQISWRNESLRRHGALERPENQDMFKELVMGPKVKAEKASGEGKSRSEEEEKLLSRKAGGEENKR